ncbi:hypothetical protein [Nocardiopsis baichengensis]|uniref:hypothetical protein n=1 Tax=Nocardiopsis baichengensis TaxID=280240 RepID=UPI001EF9F5CB|nr:hypothetical protein [Nocardiopsis baichengensis]
MKGSSRVRRFRSPSSARDRDAPAPGAPDRDGPGHAARSRRDFRFFLASHVSNELGGAVTEVALPLTAVVLLGAAPFEGACSPQPNRRPSCSSACPPGSGSTGCAGAP